MLTRPKLAAVPVAILMFVGCLILAGTGNAGRCESWACVLLNAVEHAPKLPAQSEPVYPCRHSWTYHGARYWHLHYASGGKGRTHFGVTTNYRRCF